MSPTSDKRDSQPVAAAPAGLLRRFGALLYDALLIVALWMITALVGVIINSGDSINSSAMQLLMLAEVIVFYGYFWHDRGQTLGMRAWRLLLVDQDGGQVTWSAIAKRMIVGPLSLLLMGLGYLWYFVGTRQQTWHDRFSDTYVVLLPKDS